MVLHSNLEVINMKPFTLKELAEMLCDIGQMYLLLYKSVIVLLIFYLYQEMVTKEYQNLKFQQPYQQAMYYCSLILQDRTWPWMEELEILPHVEADDLAKFVPLMLSRAFLECYVAGSRFLTFLPK